jgi:hypothetical protein
LTPLDLFLCDYVNNYIYVDKIQDLNNLKARIREAVEQATTDMLQSVWQGEDICTNMNDAHVETH